MTGRAACGTSSGYRRHHRLGETPCEPCREAHKVYQRERYQRVKGTRQGIYEQNRKLARERAMQRLTLLHPTQFRALLDEEIDKLDMPPIEEHAPGRKR